MQKYRKFIIIGVVLLVALLGWLAYREFFTFYLKGTSPNTASVSSSSPYVKLNFNKQLKNDGYTLDLKMDDQDIFVDHKVEGKTFKVYLPTNMEVGQAYVLTLSNISATDGKTLSATLEFTTKDIPVDELDKEQQDELLRLQSDLRTNEVNDPILQELPHGTLNYNLSAFISGGEGTDVPGDRLTLQAQIMLSSVDIKSGQDAAVARAQSDIAAWITSLGLDPANYQIEYTVTQL